MIIELNTERISWVLQYGHPSIKEVGSFSNDNGDGNEKVTNLHI